MAYEGLLHDASEAFIGDVARPIKASGEVGVLYGAAEDRLMEIIAEKFHVTWPMLGDVKWADNVLLRTEQRDLMPPTNLYDLSREEMVDEKIRPWQPHEAEGEFIDRYNDLTARLGLS
jgi:hypothetical protein